MAKNKIITILIFALVIFVFITGCSKPKEEIKEPVVEKTTVEEPVIEKPIVEEPQNEEPESEEPVEVEKTTGELLTEKMLSQRPIAVMYDNYYMARPQAGLSEASIVYEILAEGNITRYMGVFFGGAPELIGPVRSARPYFVDRALEYKALYVHAGGSEAALADINDFAMGDIDGLKAAYGIFWRENHKKIPNNMYTSEKTILKEAARRKHFTEVKFDYIKYNDEDISLNGDTCSEVKFVYNTGKYGYNSSFKYNEKTKLYERYINGNRHKDEVDETEIDAKNIIVQIADKKVLDSIGRLEVYTTGKGSGYFITNGNRTEITWKKENRSSLTRYYYELGNEVEFNPGTTWIQVVPKESYIGW